MTHYHVWFDLQPGIPEPSGLAAVQRFLQGLCEADEAVAFQLLRNAGSPPRSKLPHYHALIAFADDSQLTEAMKKQAARGIHSGWHGAMIEVVANFHVEVFTLLEEFEPVGCSACDI
jgi:hypothetical protein